MYSEEHEWIELSEDGKIGTVGITPYASKALGDVIFVELPELGLEVGRGDPLGAVESVKSASDILSPIAGKVVETNAVLEETPGHINKDPEGEGWIAKMEVREDAKEETEQLMDAQAYQKFTEESDQGDH
jgi:glycine cleavage system H protein